MVEEGLVNSDYETIGWQDQEAMTMTSDNVGAFLHWGGYLGVGSERDEDFPGLTPLNESNMVVSSGFQGGGLVITDKCEHPELVAQWADYFYSEEGGRLLWMGLEGESYKPVSYTHLDVYKRQASAWNCINGNASRSRAVTCVMRMQWGAPDSPRASISSF